MRYAQPELVDRLAAAYVLGTLSQRARRRFERLHRERIDVRLAVGGWEARLNRLGASVPPVQPPHRVWQAIDRATHGPTPQHAAAPRRRWWLPVGAGAAGLVAGGVLTAALLFALPSLIFTPDQVAMRSGQVMPQSYVGVLNDAQGNGKLLVSSLRHGRVMTLKVIGAVTAPAPGSRYVLWAVPAEGAPFVLGEVPTSGTRSVQLPDTSEKLLSKVGRLKVTVETQARPTTPSPVTLFTGTCAKLW